MQQEEPESQETEALQSTAPQISHAFHTLSLFSRTLF